MMGPVPEHVLLKTSTGPSNYSKPLILAPLALTPGPPAPRAPPLTPTLPLSVMPRPPDPLLIPPPLLPVCAHPAPWPPDPALLAPLRGLHLTFETLLAPLTLGFNQHQSFEEWTVV